MNREQMVEKVAHQIWDEDERAYWDSERDVRPMNVDDPDEELAEAARDWRLTVSRVVDAILPQVTTEAERDALPTGVVVLSAQGTIACRSMFGVGALFGDERPIRWNLLALPLTVLWTPGDES